MNNLRCIQYARVYYPSIYATSPAAILFIRVSSRRRIRLDPLLVLSSTSIGRKYALNTSSLCLQPPNTILRLYGRGGKEAKVLVGTTQRGEVISVVYSNTMTRLYCIEAIQPLVDPGFLQTKPVHANEFKVMC